MARGEERRKITQITRKDLDGLSHAMLVMLLGTICLLDADIDDPLSEEEGMLLLLLGTVMYETKMDIIRAAREARMLEAEEEYGHLDLSQLSEVDTRERISTWLDDHREA